MARPWSIAGEYLEACSCAYLRPCVTSNVTAPATEGFCAFAMTYRIDRGRFDATDLAGVTFAIVGRSKAVMADGGWTVGLIVDERATGEQTDAVVAIASGRAGGPMAAMAPLIADFRGVERRPIRVEVSGSRRAVHVPGLLEQEIEGVPSVSVAGDCLALENTFHPANKRLYLATVLRNLTSCFGITWRDDGGARKRNGHFGPFVWSGAA